MRSVGASGSEGRKTTPRERPFISPRAWSALLSVFLPTLEGDVALSPQGQSLQEASSPCLLWPLARGGGGAGSGGSRRGLGFLGTVAFGRCVIYGAVGKILSRVSPESRHVAVDSVAGLGSWALGPADHRLQSSPLRTPGRRPGGELFLSEQVRLPWGPGHAHLLCGSLGPVCPRVRTLLPAARPRDVGTQCHCCLCLEGAGILTVTGGLER